MTGLQFDQIIQSAAVQLPDKSVPADTVAKASSGMKVLENMSLDDFINRAVSGLVDFAIHLAIAILVFYVGKFIIQRIYKVVDSIFIRRQFDRSLSTFILSLIRILLYFILVVTVISILGIETSSFLAIFASAGVAIGLALSGTLQNFAGGVLILLLKPYKIGDYIEAQGFSGTVKEIQIFSTIINTADNKQIIIPNGPLSTSTINNYSKEDYRRVDWTVSIAYGDDVDVAKSYILEMLLSDSRVVKKYVEDDRKERNMPPQHSDIEIHEAEKMLEEPVKISWWRRTFSSKKTVAGIANKIEERHAQAKAMLEKPDRSPFVALSTLNSSSIDLVVRAWTPASSYWGLYFDMNERFYKELPEKGLHFPFPQMDVHLQKSDS
ncbi:MAG: mechanosensitive ion channel [Muribaculum sp.]|nr:mechanosensitive ion channel [Muribaculum sp.]